MTQSDLDKPAELTVWPGHAPSRAADARSFPTLRAALAAAAKAIVAEDAKPWIITEAGDILAPGWIRANTDAHRLQQWVVAGARGLLSCRTALILTRTPGEGVTGKLR